MNQEPEYITIIEGPTPEFHEDVQAWNLGIYQSLNPAGIAFCQLRTGNGKDIRDRCVGAWQEGRRVQLDFPDTMRLRKKVDVVAMRLQDTDEGMVLNLWLHNPVREELMNDGDGADLDFDDDMPF